MPDFFVRTADAAAPDEWTAVAVCDDPALANYLADKARARDIAGQSTHQVQVITERALQRAEGVRGVTAARTQAAASPLWQQVVRAQSQEPLIEVDRAYRRSESSKQRLRRAIQDALDAKFTLQQVADFAHLSHEHVRRLSAPLAPDASDLRQTAAQYLRSRIVMPTGFKGHDDALPGGGVRHGQLAMVAHSPNAGGELFALQVVVNMAKAGKRCAIVSLERTRENIIIAITQQLMDLELREAELLLLQEDGILIRDLDKVLRNIVIIDAVDTEPGLDPLLHMTVPRMYDIVEESRKQFFEGASLDVMMIDTLGHLAVDEAAPVEVLEDPNLHSRYLMQSLFAITKRMQCYTLVVANLPRAVSPGVEFPYDAGRGGGKQTDYCDYVYSAWAPADEHGIPEDERLARMGQLRVRLAKNRHGPAVTEYLVIDRRTLAVLPSEHWSMSFELSD